MKFHSKAPRGLVALGSAAVIAVYSAGFVRTRAAAAKFDAVPAVRRPAPDASPATAVTRESSAAPAAPKARAPLAEATKVPPTTPAAPTRTVAAPVAVPARPTAPAATATSSEPTKAAPAAAPAVVASTPAPAVSAAPAAAPVTTTATAPAVPPSATDAAAPAKPADSATPQPQGKYKDGSYVEWGTSRHGDLEVTVVIEDGRIASANITTCNTRYPCSYIAHLQAQVVVRQSAGVDYVSGATESADAFYYAVLEALTKAHR